MDSKTGKELSRWKHEKTLGAAGHAPTAECGHSRLELVCWAQNPKAPRLRSVHKSRTPNQSQQTRNPTKQQTHNSQKTKNPQNQQIHSPTKNQQQPETSKHKSKIRTKASKHTKNNKHTTKTTSTQNQQTQKQNTHQSLVLDTAAFDVVFLSLERILFFFLG